MRMNEGIHIIDGRNIHYKEGFSHRFTS